MKPKNTMFALRCHKELIDAIDLACEHFGINRSEFVRMSVVVSLDNAAKKLSKSNGKKVIKAIDSTIGDYLN